MAIAVVWDAKPQFKKIISVLDVSLNLLLTSSLFEKQKTERYSRMMSFAIFNDFNIHGTLVLLALYFACLRKRHAHGTAFLYVYLEVSLKCSFVYT